MMKVFASLKTPRAIPCLFAILALAPSSPSATDRPLRKIVHVWPPDFEAAVDSVLAADGVLADVDFRLAPGTYHLRAKSYLDPTCGNCEDPDFPVEATVGLRISGRNIGIAGENPYNTIIRTNAGYGLFFEDCENCALSKVTVTGGARDPDSRASDAAVVVRRSRASVVNCRIRDNLGDARLLRDHIVGIMGICGREDSEIWISQNHILRNSWDGIALYRDATANINDNVVDGIDAARAAELGGGRGVGIGVTWNARARISDNLVRNYWKGIGVFVDADATIADNILEDLLTWGIALWDAGAGKPRADIYYNLIFATGACGIAVTLPADSHVNHGTCHENLLVRTGQNPRYDDPGYYCMQCPVAVDSAPSDFARSGNLAWDSRRVVPDSSSARDVCAETELDLGNATDRERLRAAFEYHDRRYRRTAARRDALPIVFGAQSDITHSRALTVLRRLLQPASADDAGD